MVIDMKKHLPAALSTLVFAALYYYIALPPINLRARSFWGSLILLAIIYYLLYCLFNKKAVGFRLSPGRGPSLALAKPAKRALIIAAAVLVLALVVSFVTSSRIFNAPKYQKMLTVNESDFAADIAELPLSQIPIVDRDTAARLGSRKIGEVVELVSQFNVSAYYTQINFTGKPYRVSPLEYDGFLKWIANRKEGIPYYVKIDMATQNTELVKLPKGMRYSPSEYFSRDLMRHVRFAYPTKMFEEISFEIDDAGNPYWVISYFHYTFGIFGGHDIKGIILVDAVTGDMTDYPVSQVPQWIDRVYPAALVIEQADNWGTLKNGYFNSIFAQKNVVTTTDGYNYIALNDDVWLFTGVTSVVADESNIGFLLVNMRTKETRFYAVNGAEEYSAMASAEGVVQDKGYYSTFPILVNVADRPSYFLSLKDNAGLVKAYAFVSVSNYQIVGVADTIEGALAEYRRLLGGSITDPSGTEITGKISRIASAVKDGNSVYYLEIDGTIYTAPITVSDRLPLLSPGDQITFTVNNSSVITQIK